MIADLSDHPIRYETLRWTFRCSDETTMRTFRRFSATYIIAARITTLPFSDNRLTFRFVLMKLSKTKNACETILFPLFPSPPQISQFPYSHAWYCGPCRPHCVRSLHEIKSRHLLSKVVQSPEHEDIAAALPSDSTRSRNPRRTVARGEQQVGLRRKLRIGVRCFLTSCLDHPISKIVTFILHWCATALPRTEEFPVIRRLS